MIYSKFYQIPAGLARERIAYLLDFLELSAPEPACSALAAISGRAQRHFGYGSGPSRH
jgi:hypothetical protein